MIVVVDYEMGNLRSIAKALEYVGGNIVISNQPHDIERAEKIVLPGVGAFGDGIKNLTKRGLDRVLKKEVLERKKPVLGICLGMQLLADKSYELGEWEGLGIISGEVKKVSFEKSLRVPHVGWNNVALKKPHELMMSIADDSHFYFAHSYYFDCADTKQVVATARYNTDFPAIIARDNIFATQFHPEKSQKDGLMLLKNFVRWQYVEK